MEFVQDLSQDIYKDDEGQRYFWGEADMIFYFSRDCGTPITLTSALLVVSVCKGRLSRGWLYIRQWNYICLRFVYGKLFVLQCEADMVPLGQVACQDRDNVRKQ